MHRIDGPAAGVGGVFVEGDPTVGTPSTVVTEDWANAVQEELCSVIEGASLVLSKPNNGQLLAAVLALLAKAVPVGQVVQGYWPTAPAGFLLCSGGLVSRSAYPALWAHASAAGLVVAEATWAATAWTMFGAGDGSTTFRLPDLRGESVRGADMGRGADPGRVLGSYQSDATQNATGTIGLVSGGVAATGAFAADGAAVNHITAGTAGSDPGVTFDLSRVVRTAAETRVRNVALAFAVRF